MTSNDFPVSVGVKPSRAVMTLQRMIEIDLGVRVVPADLERFLLRRFTALSRIGHSVHDARPAER